MQVDYQDLDVLLEIQKLDLAVMQLKKARAELPQRIEIVKIRKKRDEIRPKFDQVVGLQEAKEKDIFQIEEEDRGLAEKQARLQEEIGNSSSDYRAVEARSRDLAGLSKRRVTLEEQLSRLNAELAKIKDVRQQVENALALCDKQEANLRSSFKGQDDELVARAQQLIAQRNDLEAGLPRDLAELYENTASKTGGVALGKLEEGRCGVCRAGISGGRLIELMSQAPLGVCPNCKRLLVVE